MVSSITVPPERVNRTKIGAIAVAFPLFPTLARRVWVPGNAGSVGSTFKSSQPPKKAKSGLVARIKIPQLLVLLVSSVSVTIPFGAGLSQ